MEPYEIVIRDLRTAADEVSIERQGFILTSHASDVARTPEISDTNLELQIGLPPINQAYYDELLPLIQRISGAREVIPQATGSPFAIAIARSARAGPVPRALFTWM